MSQHYFIKLIESAASALTSAPFHSTREIEIPSPEQLCAYIDHTLLKPDATTEEILTLCQEAKRYQFAAVCVAPHWVPLCVEQMAENSMPVCSVVGFPLGASTSENKALEAEELIALGANEIDMVLNISRLKDKEYTYVYEDILQVVASGRGKIVKVILETCLLTEQEKIAACVLSKEAGAHFVKTSTGFGRAGATVEDVALLRQVVGHEMGVKASGGIRDYETAVAMIKAGATRIGTSSGVMMTA
ncbi:MAG: deoxyribose-phosphate aldolase [Calditrichaeota bacterium]|nr:MAG: deoxyribose-phosphate aldolase [Calditrichota bacterium]